MAGWPEFTAHQNEPLRNVYLLTGDDGALVLRAKDMLVARALDGSSFDVTRMSGRPDLDALGDAVSLMPLLGGRRCIVLDDLDVNALPQADYDRLCELLAEVPDDAVVVIVASREKSGKKGDRRRSFAALVGKLGAVFTMKPLDDASLKRIFLSQMNKAGIKTDNAAAAALVRAAPDYSSFQNELHKLLFAGRETITERDVLELCPEPLETSVYNLTKTLLRGDYRASAQLLDDLLRDKTEPMMIAAIVNNYFIDLCRAYAGAKALKGDNVIADDFGYKNRAFVIANARRDMARLTGAQLRTCLKILARCDERMKSTALPPDLLLHDLLLDLYMTLRRAA